MIGRTACLEHAVEPDGINECRSAILCDDTEAYVLKNFEREKSAVLPSAQPQSLGCQEHVLADRRRFAKDVVAGLPLDNRQRQHPFGIKEAALQPALRAGWPTAVAVIDNVHAAACRRVAAQRRIDELRDLMKSAKRSHRIPAETGSSPAGSSPRGRDRSSAVRGAGCRAGHGVAADAAPGMFRGAWCARPQSRSRAACLSRSWYRGHRALHRW